MDAFLKSDKYLEHRHQLTPLIVEGTPLIHRIEQNPSVDSLNLPDLSIQSRITSLSRIMRAPTTEEMKAIRAANAAAGAKLSPDESVKLNMDFITACKTDNTEEMKALYAKGADVNFTTKDGKNTSPIHYAAVQGHAKVIAFLCDHGADVNAQDVRGTTAFHFAVVFDHMLAAETLHEKYHCDLNPGNINGDRPIHYACQNGKLAMVKYLHKVDADLSVENNLKKVTAFFL